MGILDDAIREHLDLKRRRGADPGEVERAEREALGPVRRNRESPVAESADEPAAGGLAYDQADDGGGWAYEDDERVVAPAEQDLPPLELESDRDRTGSRPAAPEPVIDANDLPPAPPPRFAQGTGAETAEYDVEEALAADGGPTEDMLEETPEFLQDTPDHDRLWFEQRPPKDFDFDS